MKVLKATGIAAALVMGVVTPASADGLTTIRIKVTGCNGCKIFAHDSAHRDWSTVKHGYSRILDRAKVRNGKATLKVPTAQTPGMSFAVYDGPYSTGGGVPMVAVRYQGKAVGETVSEYEAAGAATGSFCWAGTDRKRVSMRFAATKWINPSVPKAAPGYHLMQVWAATTLPSWYDDVNMQETLDGGLGNQQGPFCFRRR